MSKHLPPKKNKHEKEAGKSLFNTPLRLRKTSHIKNELAGLNTKNYIFTAAAAVLLLAGFVLPFDGWVPMVVFGLSFAAGAFQVALSAAEKALALQLLEADILMLAACITTMAVGNFPAAAVLMLSYRLLMLLEGCLEKHSAKLRADFYSFLPETALLVTDRGIDEIEPERVAVDDILEVRPGGIIPVDGYVVEGISAIDASALTGTAATRDIGVGSTVFSGCINLSGTIRMKAEAIYAESCACLASAYLDKAERFKPKGEKFCGRFERYYTPVVVLLALVCAVAVPAFKGEWREWIGRGAAVLALSGCGSLALSLAHGCRCALAWAIRRGIVFKGTAFLESLGLAQTFVFNKTGTLTEGKYIITDIVPTGMSADEFLSTAAHVESISDHPIARAICWAYGAGAGEGLDIYAREIPGRGIEAEINGTEIIFGNALLMAEHGVSCDMIPSKNTCTIHMAIDGSYAGYMVLSDKIRENAFDQLERLRLYGVRSMVTLTADMRSVAKPLASSLNMEMVRSELSAEGKVSAVEYLMATKAERSTLAFVCDGAGDPEALTRADVGISFGAADHREAFEKADILILERRLSALPQCMAISRQICRMELIHLAFYITAKLLLIALAFFGVLGVSAVAVLDLLLSAALSFNAASLIKFDDNRRSYR